MTLFPLSALLLKFNRGRLPRDKCVSVSVVFLTFAVVFTLIGGNIAIDPTIVGCANLIAENPTPLTSPRRYAAAYIIAIVAIFYGTMKKVHLVRWMFWLYDQSPFLHTMSGTKSWGDKMVAGVRRMRSQPVCLLIKTDEVCLRQ